MAADLPTREDIRPGMTVEVEQEGADPDERLVGEVRLILTEERTHPGGIEVELESGVVGRVKAIHPEEP